MKNNKEIPLSVTTSSSTNQKAASSFSITSESPTTLPPGKYWIGDLSYVMKKRWGDFCEKIELDEDAKNAEYPQEVKKEGPFCWYHFTETGDGCYEALKNTLPKAQVPDSGFFVDAGLIGIVPFDLTDSLSADYSSGMTVTFADEVKCSYEDGLFHFKSGRGGLVIDSVPEGLTGIMSALAKLS